VKARPGRSRTVISIVVVAIVIGEVSLTSVLMLVLAEGMRNFR
jgi:hypothetical protein